jgi:hypothetical protein
MNLLDIAATVIRDVLIAVGVLTALLVGFMIAAVRLPRGNPFRRVLDVAYDIAAPLGLLVFWVTFLRKAVAILRQARASPGSPNHAKLPES